MCAVVPRNLGKGAVPAPVASPKPNVWPLDRQSVSLRAPRHPMTKERACSFGYPASPEGPTLRGLDAANASPLDHDQGRLRSPLDPIDDGRSDPRLSTHRYNLCDTARPLLHRAEPLSLSIRDAFIHMAKTKKQSVHSLRCIHRLHFRS